MSYPPQNIRLGIFTLVICLFTCLHARAHVGIGTINPDPDSLLDLTSTVAVPGGMLLPRLTLTSSSLSNPLSNHVAGMLVYNTATSNDVYPGVYVNDGTRWIRAEDHSKLAESVTLSGDRVISSSTYAAVPGMSNLIFTARSTEVLVMLTASGLGYTNSMSNVLLKVQDITTLPGTVVGGAGNKVQSYDWAVGATTTAWSVSFNKVYSGLTIGNTYTLQVQGLVHGVIGTYDAVIAESTYPESCHMTLTVVQ